MAGNLVVNGNNSLTKGTVIFEKGQPLQVVGLIVRGRVTVEGKGIHTTLGTGNFLGMYDVAQGRHSFTSVALDDCVIYGLSISGPKQACLLLDEKPQYRGLLITSINYFIQDIYRTYLKIQKQLEEVSKFVLETYHKYLHMAEQSGLMTEKLVSIDKLSKEKQEATIPERIQYYIQCCRIPVEAQKNYYGANAYVAKSHFEEQCTVLPELLKQNEAMVELLKRYLRVMSVDEKNLFGIIGRLALGIKRAGQDFSGLSALLDNVLGVINDTESLLLEKAGVDLNLDRARMEETYFSLLSDGIADQEDYEENCMKELDDSLHQILDYAPVHGVVVEEFAEEIEKFLQLPEPFAKNQEAGSVRKKITKLFYELYEAVLLKSFEDSNPPKAVKLFLRYGYVSEQLLTDEDLKTLLSLPDSREEQMSCRVYTLPEWLKAIYDGEKLPSKNEFDMDYEADLRTQMQEGKITDRQYKAALEDTEEMLHFEIENLVRYAERILNGNITAFVPVLCSAGFFTKMNSSVVTAMTINQTVNKVEKIDYTIFYREHYIALEEVGLSRFEVTERFTPDFILFPVYGRNGLMWQDLEGRNKSSHARILLPSFMEHDLPGVVLKMMAHYRWERCRTEMGAQWNNFHYPSLTSEYTDYLQFYRKNNELSPEKREKVKAQLQQCNNKHRDVFTRDYMDWILRESTGVVKLNRVAREILYTYCPFADDKAKDILEQTTFRDAARRYIVERGKREKQMISVLRKYEKSNMDVPEEVEETRRLILGT